MLVNVQVSKRAFFVECISQVTEGKNASGKTISVVPEMADMSYLDMVKVFGLRNAEEIIRAFSAGVSMLEDVEVYSYEGTPREGYEEMSAQDAARLLDHITAAGLAAKIMQEAMESSKKPPEELPPHLQPGNGTIH